jgi:hypothetical protein
MPFIKLYYPLRKYQEMIQTHKCPFENLIDSTGYDLPWYLTTSNLLEMLAARQNAGQ